MINDLKLLEIVKEKLSAYNFPYSNASMFMDLKIERRHELLSIIDKYSIGVPLVFYSQTSGGWIIIGTNSLVINNWNEINILNFENIRNVRSDPKEKEIKINSNESFKFELSNWIIEDSSGKSYLISIDKGEIWNSFYHVLVKIVKTKGYLLSE